MGNENNEKKDKRPAASEAGSAAPARKKKVSVVFRSQNAQGLKELPKMMGSEDFAYFMEKVPGVFGFLGSHDAEHAASNHNDHYDVPESVLKRGAALHAQFAVDYLAAKAE